MAGLSCHSLRNSILALHLLLLHFSETQLIGPNQPIIATAGEDITLPCHLVQVENVATKTLEWTRPDLDPRFVFVWRAGQDFVNVKNPSYKGRSSLFTDELKCGNISLKLSKVKPADEGRYRCYIPDKNEETFIDLVVASGTVSSPVINLEGIDRDKVGVILECKSKGWHPKPEVLWLDGEGNLLPAGPTETRRDPDDFYTVSSRVTMEKKSGNNFTCKVQQKNINQSRETHIQVSDEFFMFTTSSATPIIIGLAIILAVSIMLVLIGVFFIWRQNKTKVKRDHCNESEKQEMMNHSKSDKTETDQEQKNLVTQDIVPLEKNQRPADKKLKEANEKLKEAQHDLEKKDAEISELKKELEKKQAAEKKLKVDTEELNRNLEKKDTEISKLKKQLEKNQEANKMLKEDNEKLNFQLQTKSSVVKEPGKQPQASKLNKPQPEKCQRNFQEQNKSSSATHSLMRGDIILEEVDRHGHYICLKNSSSEDKLMGHWKLKLQINKTQPVTYKFKGNYTLKAGQELILRQPGTRNPYLSYDDHIWQDLRQWSPEDDLKINLISNTGEQHKLK